MDWIKIFEITYTVVLSGGLMVVLWNLIHMVERSEDREERDELWAVLEDVDAKIDIEDVDPELARRVDLALWGDPAATAEWIDDAR